eukprot:GEZU01023389.1.p1 GENE.GEZU01023389.1~~GEZU01023389.1.p1  ORF type:complete len:118 (-),score=12.38 GEZU01023389.1:6-359(-)
MNRKNPEMSFERTGIKGGSKFTARSSLFGGPGGANGIRSSTSASTSVGSQYSTEYDEQVQALQEQENDQHLEKLKQGVEYLGQVRAHHNPLLSYASIKLIVRERKRERESGVNNKQY